jgi:hypothetical protein
MVGRRHHQEALHRICVTILTDSLESSRIIHSDFRKSLLPNRREEPEFAPCPKRKPTLDQLNGFFYRHLLEVMQKVRSLERTCEWSALRIGIDI